LNSETDDNKPFESNYSNGELPLSSPGPPNSEASVSVDDAQSHTVNDHKLMMNGDDDANPLPEGAVIEDPPQMENVAPAPIDFIPPKTGLCLNDYKRLKLSKSKAKAIYLINYNKNLKNNR
jgi:hypothetical protein